MRIDVTLTGDGTERDVAVLAPQGTTLGQVAPLLPGCPGGDGPLGHPTLATGALVGAPERVAASAYRLVVVGGPAGGRGVRLGAEPVIVGRAGDCDLPLPDPRLSRRHLEVSWGPRGALVRDLGSANGTTVDGCPVAGAGRDLAPGDLVRAADTFLGIVSGTPRALPVRPTPEGAALVAPAPVRSPERPGTTIETPVPPSPPPPVPIQWVAMLVPAAAAAVLAAVIGTWTFLLLAVLSPVALIAGSLGQRWGVGRAGRRARGEHERVEQWLRAAVRSALRLEERSRRSAAPGPAEIALIAGGPGTRLWERRPGTEGLLRVRLGLADADSRLQVSRGGVVETAGSVASVPHEIGLDHAPLALSGPPGPCRAVARWLLAQLATLVSPADLEVVVLTDRPSDWRWVRWLPHWDQRVAVNPAAQRALLDTLAAERAARAPTGSRRRLLLVLDGCPETAAAAALLDDASGGGSTGIWITRGGVVPGCPLTTVSLDDSGTRLRLPDGRTVVADQVDLPWAEQIARSLAPLLPDGPSAAALPPRVRLLDLTGPPHPWTAPRPGLPFVLGSGPSGPLVLDLVRDGPHVLVAGTTGAGKSELLRTMIAALALAHPPDRLAFVLVDYKGGAAFADCALLPHATGCVTDLDSHLTARALRSLERELQRREALLAEAGAAHLDAYAAAPGATPLARLVIVVDEFAALADELPDFVSGLVGIAQRGRSLGIHLVLATQRPGGVVSPEIRANTSLRIALRVTDAADSRDVIDCDGAATLDRRTPGRAIVRVAGADPVPVQVATVSMSPPGSGTAIRVLDLDDWRRPLRAAPTPCAGTDLAEIVATLTAAAAAAGAAGAVAVAGAAGTAGTAGTGTTGGFARPRPPWLPPLPDVIPAGNPSELLPAAAGVVTGLADLPDEQSQRAFSVDVAGGCALTVAGGPRSGRTGALLTLALEAARRYSPEQLQINVVDLAGDLAVLADLPHTGSVVSDVTGGAALLRRVAAALPSAGRQLLLVDAFDRFLAASEQVDDGIAADALLALFRSAASRGITVAVAGDRTALQPRIAGSASVRLALRLPDPGDYALAGLAPRAVPRRMPPGRAVSCPDGVEIQLTQPPADPAAAVARVAASWPGPRPERIEIRPLPERVWLEDVLRDLPREPGRVVLGVGGEEARPLAVDLFAGGGRLIVCGPPGSGRSTVLRSLQAQARGHGWDVAIAAPARSPLGTGPARTSTTAPGHPLLVLIDDAEDLLDTEAEAATLAVLADRARGDSPTALVVATTSEQAAIGYRGVIAAARRDRCLILLHPGPVDATLVNARLPRHPGASPPGRGVVLGSRHWGAAFTAGPLPLQVAAPPDLLSGQLPYAGSGDPRAGRVSP